ncbi:cytochrome P450 [Pleionea mediterranea]|nr:cytochrome P450 [Pleionea mediterranea]
MPGPKGKWFIGDAMKFDEDPVGWMLDTKPIYGDIVRLDNETIVIHDPDLIDEVFKKTNNDFILDNATVSGKQGREKLIKGLTEWMQSRKYLGKALNRNILSQHIGRANDRLSVEVEKLAGTKVDLFNASQYLLGFSIADFCLGADLEIDQVFKKVEEVFWASLAVTDSEESRLPWASRPIAKRAERLNNELVSMLKEVVIRRQNERKLGEPYRDALDQLVDNLPDAPVEQLAAAVRLMMVTAHGPSGAVFSWCLLRLTENPELIEVIRNELSQDSEQLLFPNNYPVTLAVLKETMRLHPANWLMGRTAQRNTLLGGFKIPEDCRVLFSPYILHRDKRFWDNPDEFNHKRWLNSQDISNKKAYIPFGAGPRVCPGALLGPMQLMVGLKVILSNYDLELPPLDSARPVHSTLLRPKNVQGSWSCRK